MESKSILKVPTYVAGSYEILEKIGSGSFGVTYRGRNTELSQDVAIKLVKEFIIIGS